MLKVLAAVAALCAAGGAQAAVVADSLPYQGTPYWTDVVFAGTSMTTNGTTSTLTTAQQRGVWFGWSAGSNPPAWSLGSNAAGNYVRLDMQLTSGARDWSVYLHDGQRSATIVFNPTDCNGNAVNCTLANFAPGVRVYARDSGGAQISQFFNVDTTQRAVYEFVLKGDTASYRIDGVAWTRQAEVSGSNILVIGDGSGSTLTGWGSMIVHGVSIDTAPSFDTLQTTVPEPSAWALMIGGLGLVGGALRRRRLAVA